MIRSTSNDRKSGDARSASPLDRQIGSRVRLARQLSGMSQEKLGEHLGVTFQQVQKYERGGNRVSASRLLTIAKVTDQPLAFFYQTFDDAPELAEESGDMLALEGYANLDPKDARDVLAALDRFTPRVRSRLIDLIRVIDPTEGSAKP